MPRCLVVPRMGGQQLGCVPGPKVRFAESLGRLWHFLRGGIGGKPNALEGWNLKRIDVILTFPSFGATRRSTGPGNRGKWGTQCADGRASWCWQNLHGVPVCRGSFPHWTMTQH